MGVTKQIQRGEWRAYFDELVKRHLERGPTGAGAIEVLSPAFGDQPEVTRAPLIGIDYDPKSNALEVALEGVDHLVFHPEEIWVIEEEDGFVSALEAVRDDGTKEIIRLQRGGAPEPAHPAP